MNKCFAVFLLLSLATEGLAEDGYDLWMRYRPIGRPIGKGASLEKYRSQATEIVVRGKDEVLESAAEELTRGLSGLLDRKIARSENVTRVGAVVLATAEDPWLESGLRSRLEQLGPESYVIATRTIAARQATLIAGGTSRGVLYGAFHFLRLVQTGDSIEELSVEETPRCNLRMLNHWDNPARPIERGYAGPTIFLWEELPELHPRYKDYARMLASVGINGAVMNNVNTAKKGLTGWKLITAPYLKKGAALAGVLRAYGVKMYLSVNFASPIITGDLKTADPLDPAVKKWWKDKADEIYAEIPDFGGFLVKADSEGEPGPFTYGRDHAQGANMLAAALAPHGGIVLWRAFVYGHKDLDRAMQAYANFKPHDGQFAENVIVQVKNGPMDFQVREPVSPLFGRMPQTNLLLELQIAQEYTGYSTHLCYLAPQWRYYLDFDIHGDGKGKTLDTVVDGSLHGYKHAGMAGVSNIGADRNWTGHHLAQANAYAFGRLAWNPKLSSEAITREWVRMTFPHDPAVEKAISSMLQNSWRIYEDYTSPLGVGFMCGSDIKWRHHYDPDPVRRQKKYHHADKQGVGYDRTVASGSGYTAQYHEKAAQVFESLETCPDELLLFFHHVPYTHRLHSGKTVIQHIYDSHNDGVEEARKLRETWMSLKGKIDAERFEHVLGRLEEQIEHAILWRDSINNYFRDMSSIPDAREKS